MKLFPFICCKEGWQGWAHGLKLGNVEIFIFLNFNCYACEITNKKIAVEPRCTNSSLTQRPEYNGKFRLF